VIEARARAASRGVDLIVAAALIGTHLDPQDVERQRAELQTAGVYVSPSNEQAIRWIAQMLTGTAA
jgi:hypothetical protein